MVNNVSFCPNCGTKLLGPVGHCPNCGARQAAPAPQPIPQPVPQPAQNEFLNKAATIANAGVAQAKQAKEDAKEVYATLTTKQGFVSTMKNAGILNIILMALAATATIVFLTTFVILVPSVLVVVLIPAAAAFYVVRKVKGGSFAWIGALTLFIFSGLGFLAILTLSHWYKCLEIIMGIIVWALAFITFVIELKIGPMKKVHILRYVAMWLGFLGLGGQIACGCITVNFVQGIGIYELIMAAFSLAAYVIYIIMICRRRPKSWLFATIASGCFLISAFSLFHLIPFPFWAAFITLELIARSRTKAIFAAEAAAKAQAQYQAQMQAQYQAQMQAQYQQPQQPMM